MIPEEIRNKIKNVKKLKVVSTDSTKYEFDYTTDILYVPIFETDFSHMFTLCNIEEIELSIDNKIQKAVAMFNTCMYLKNIKFIKKLNLEDVDSLYFMFDSCRSLEKIDLSNMITSDKLRNIAFMFGSCSSLKEINFGDEFHSENILDVSSLFYKCISLQHIIWLKCQPFNRLIRADYAFYNCDKLKQIDLKGVCFNDVESMTSIFDNTNPSLQVLVNDTFRKYL